ncbi:hypothetical protein MMPV_007920 [Pyropia vietnamensis]
MATTTTASPPGHPRATRADASVPRERWTSVVGAAATTSTAIATAAATAAATVNWWGAGRWPVPPVSVTTWAVGMATFHVAAAIAAVADATAVGTALKVRIEVDPSRRYAALLPRVVANQVLLLLPTMVVAEAVGWAYGGPYDAHSRVGGVVSPSVPSVVSLMVVAAWMAVAHDVLFYVGHRFLLHSGWGWRAFGHHLHHTTRASTGVSAMYMSPADYIIEIVVPYLVPLAAVSRLLDRRWHAVMLAAGCVGGGLRALGVQRAGGGSGP